MSPAEVPAATLREKLAGDAGFPRWELEEWSRIGIVAGVTAAGPDQGLGLLPDVPPDVRKDRWDRFLDTWGELFNSAVISRQVHGNHVGVVTRGGEGGLLVAPDRDGHATVDRGVLLTVSVADCIPVFLADPDSGAVCLLHSGWRGTAAGILEQGVNLLKTLSTASVENIVMHCGVGVCGSCYEVDETVATAVTGVEYSRPTTLDLRGQLARQARNLGISRISASDHCTIHGGSGFFSHRRSRGSPERMVAYLGVPAA